MSSIILTVIIIRIH